MTNNFFSPFAALESVDADIFNPRFGALDAGLDEITAGQRTFSQIALTIGGTLTISGGAITVTGSAHLVDTEGSADNDILQVINGGSDGDVVFLRAASTSRKITLMKGVIQLSGATFRLENNHTLMLRKSGGVWKDMLGPESNPKASEVILLAGYLTEESSDGVLFDLDNIPGGYTALKIAWSGGGISSFPFLRYNGNTGSWYQWGAYDFSLGGALSWTSATAARLVNDNLVRFGSTILIPAYDKNGDYKYGVEHAAGASLGVLAGHRLGFWRLGASGQAASFNPITRLQIFGTSGKWAAGSAYTVSVLR